MNDDEKKPRWTSEMEKRMRELEDNEDVSAYGEITDIKKEYFGLRLRKRKYELYLENKAKEKKK